MCASQRYLSYLIAFILFACIWGCSGDDDTNPNDPGGGQNPGDPVTQAQIDKGLEVGNALMAMMPQWANGNFVGPPDKEAIFSEGCTCWIWQEDQGDPYSNPWDHTMWSFTATFYAGETPVADPGDADRVMVQVNYNHNSGYYHGEEKEVDQGSSSFIASLTVVISPIGGNPVTVSGGGTAEFTSTGTAGGTFFEHYEEFGLHLEMTLPVPGCPTGMMTIESYDEEEGPVLFSISYDGSSTAWWTLSQGWQGEFTVRGNETVVCGGD